MAKKRVCFWRSRALQALTVPQRKIVRQASVRRRSHTARLPGRRVQIKVVLLVTNGNSDMAPRAAAIEPIEGPTRTPVESSIPVSERSWPVLHRTYYPIAVAFLRKLGVRGDHVEDVCQDVFLQMVRYLPSFRGESDLKTWMYRICISEARRHRRKEKVSQLVTSMLGRSSQSESTDLEWNPERAAQRVLAGLSALPERRRTILVLFDMDGLSGAEVAEVVGCSVQSVWRELHYARSAFLEAFDPAELGAAP
jgi:RNA polymerase sigma-70 factor (ECF subfamily)